MDRADTTKHCIIIGAGISGLLAAQSLQSQNLDVLVLDKSRGVGGRMATRRIGNGVFDHGAQFFTVRDERFAALVRDWTQRGLVTEWSHGFADETGEWRNDGHARYYGVDGMTTVPKFLARDLAIRLNTHVNTINQTDNSWEIFTELGEVFHAEALIMTPPLPQSLQILLSSNVPLSPEDTEKLGHLLDYNPTFSVMALLDEASGLPQPGGMKFLNPDSDIAWIGDNSQKGISPGANAITIHASTQYSRTHLHADYQVVGQDLVTKAKPYLEADVREFQTHRWLYSEPTAIYDKPCFVADTSTPLILAGDVFVGSRIESAALSGLAAADALLALRMNRS